NRAAETPLGGRPLEAAKIGARGYCGPAPTSLACRDPPGHVTVFLLDYAHARVPSRHRRAPACNSSANVEYRNALVVSSVACAASLSSRSSASFSAPSDMIRQ